MLLLFDISESHIFQDYKKLARRTAGGYIKATEGDQSEPDKGFARHWIETKKAGILRGAYHLWCPDFDPRQQALFFHRAVKSGGDLGELPPALHVQVPGSAADVRQCAEEIERLFGRTPVIYTRKSAFGEPVHQPGGSQRVVTRCTQSGRTDQVDGLAGDKSWAGRYPLWFANFIPAPQEELIAWSPDMLQKLAQPRLPQKEKLPSSWRTWRIWQFSESGRQTDWGADPESSEPIGLNLFEGTREDLRNFGQQEAGQTQAEGLVTQAGTQVPAKPVAPHAGSESKAGAGSGKTSASNQRGQAKAGAGGVKAVPQTSPAPRKADGEGQPRRRAFGIDISSWQRTFRPPPPETNDLDFIILKASQANFPDDTFEGFYAAARGIPIRGAYHYFITSSVLPADGQPLRMEAKAGKDKNGKKSRGDKKGMNAGAQSSQPALLPGFTWEEQAETFLNQVKGKDFAFTALDLETGGGTDPRTKRKIINKYSRQDVKGIRRWVDEVKKRTGKPVLLYTRATVFGPHIQPNGGEILKDIDLWIARYPDDPATSADGEPYDGNELVKIPGRNDWRFWQYSDRNNGRGAHYGAKTASVDLNVFNGTREELAGWLGVELTPAGIPQLAGVEFGLLETAEAAVAEPLQQLETLRSAGLAPMVHLSIELQAADLPALQDLLAALRAAGIPPQQVHIIFPAGWEGTASLGAEIEKSHSGMASEAIEEEPIDVGRPDYGGEEGTSFLVEIARKGGKRSVLRSFSEKDPRGRPIMEPYSDSQSGDRLARVEGDRLRVSARHKLSDADPGDGRIWGADGKYYYYITSAPENENAAGLYVRKAHTRRL